MIHFLTKQKETYDFNADITISEVVKYLKNMPNNLFVVDTETSEINYLLAEILLIQLGDDVEQFIIDTKAFPPSKLKPIFRLLESPDYTKVLANVSFDYKMLFHIYGVELRNTRDILINDRVITCGSYDDISEAIYKAEHHGVGRFSLAGMAEIHLNVLMDKQIRGGFLRHQGGYTREQIVYSAEDIRIPYILLPLIDDNGKKYGVTETLSLENRTTTSFAEMEYNGLKLNTGKWEALYKSKMLEMQESEKVLDLYINQHEVLSKKYSIPIQKGLFKGMDGRTCKINWRSWEQRIKVLEDLGVDVWTKSKKSREFKKTSGKEHIQQFKDDFEFIPLLINHGELGTAISTFGRNFFEFINEITGRIHTSFKQILVTGRTSSSKPNLQNIPNDNRYRECFEAEEGNVLVTADYSNMELRIIADKSKDEVLLKAFSDGEDVHSIIAMKIYKAAYGKEIEVSKSINADIRYEYKTITFSLAYGAAAYTIHKRLGVTMERAQELIDLYFHAFPALRDYFAGLAAYGLKHGYIRTYPPYSRIRWFPQYKEYQKSVRRGGMHKEQFKRMLVLKGSIEREAMNMPIQGTAADVIKQAQYMIQNYYREFNKKYGLTGTDGRARLCLQVHDELVTEVKEQYAKELAEQKVFLMEMAGNETMNHISLTAEYNINKVWQK